jgi:hypothetical protein
MNRIVLFSSANVKEVYKLYQILNPEFLKKFKFTADFQISTFSSSQEFSLCVDHASQEEGNWLKDEALKIVERNFEKVVDET